MSTFKVEIIKLPARVGSMSLIGVGKQRPVSWGNYFDLWGGERVVNMWAENLEHLVETGVLEDRLIEGVLYEHDSCQWFLVTDPRVPQDYLYNKLCFTGCRRPPLEIAEDMYDRVGGDIHGELEEWTDPVSYWAKRNSTYDPKTGIISTKIEAKSRTLKCEFTAEVSQELKSMHGVDLLDELQKVLIDEIVKEDPNG